PGRSRPFPSKSQDCVTRLFLSWQVTSRTVFETEKFAETWLPASLHCSLRLASVASSTAGSPIQAWMSKRLVSNYSVLSKMAWPRGQENPLEFRGSGRKVACSSRLGPRQSTLLGGQA